MGAGARRQRETGIDVILLDRGYDPVTPGYDYVTVKSLDELNTMLGI